MNAAISLPEQLAALGNDPDFNRASLEGTTSKANVDIRLKRADALLAKL